MCAAAADAVASENQNHMPMGYWTYYSQRCQPHRSQPLCAPWRGGSENSESESDGKSENDDSDSDSDSDNDNDDDSDGESHEEEITRGKERYVPKEVCNLL